MTLVGGRHVWQAKWHANVAVRWTLAPTNTRRPEALLRCGPVEPWDVDADAQLTTLAWVAEQCQVGGGHLVLLLLPEAPEMPW